MTSEANLPPSEIQSLRLATALRYTFIALAAAAALLLIGIEVLTRGHPLALWSRWALAVDGPLLLTVAAVFIGACAAGTAGFAFSAITGAMLFHWMAPAVAVPLLLACSVTTQLVSIVGLRKTIQWRRCLWYVAGGLGGIPAGATLLRDLSPAVFAALFGVFLILYSGYMLLRPSAVLSGPDSPLLEVVIGLGGGVLGGAIAFPGALPTMWCCLRGLPKDVQRGTIQPDILLMQIATLAYYSRIGLLASSLSWTFALCAPAVIAGTCVGLHLFRRVNDAGFRRIILIFLMGSGVALTL